MNEVVQHASRSESGVSFSDAATNRVMAYMNQQGGMHRVVRLSVKKTGCSGLSYVIDYVVSPKDSDVTCKMDAGYTLAIDKASYPYLKGMNVDYIKQGLNHKFVFNNPNQTGQCGCGESFTVD